MTSSPGTREPEAPAPGLRERKKARTRTSIREHALRLFHEQGYQATTVEQIADAAEVSPSTFFRYFPSKEAVVLADDVDPLMIAALHAQPPELGPIAALRAAFEDTLGRLTEEEMAREHARHALILSVPELRGMMYEEFGRTVSMLADALAQRYGRTRGDFETKVFAGAVAGAALAALQDDPAMDYRAALRALDFLEAGLPL